MIVDMRRLVETVVLLAVIYASLGVVFYLFDVAANWCFVDSFSWVEAGWYALGWPLRFVLAELDAQCFD